jgi:uncharacterized membrane protein YtjA (UPF0391 family)
MLTYAIVFLIVAILAGVFGMMAAGPIGLIAFVIFLGLSVRAGMAYMGERRRRPRA